MSLKKERPEEKGNHQPSYKYYNQQRWSDYEICWHNSGVPVLEATNYSLIEFKTQLHKMEPISGTTKMTKNLRLVILDLEENQILLLCQRETAIK